MTQKPDARTGIDTGLDKVEFNRLMAMCGPFEDKPVLAVAVSGGADSMALCLLANDWAASRGGQVIALTVDHGLRPEAGAEAVQVGSWLQKAGIEHHVLCWTGTKPETGIQEAARVARYRLMEEFCAGRNILHLLAAHHLEDQAETFLIRLARGSGVDGLAGMASVTRLPQGQRNAPLLVRPLLPIPKARLRATLKAYDQPWVEDPSNRKENYQRVRARQFISGKGFEGLDSARLAKTATAMARAKEALEQQTLTFLAENVRVHKAGFAMVAGAGFYDLPGEIGLRVLARLAITFGGRVYTPRLDRLQRLYDVVNNTMVEHGKGGWTLSGCQFEVRKNVISVYREAANCTSVLPLKPGMRCLWDGRFDIELKRGLKNVMDGNLVVKRLGREGWRKLVAAEPDLRQSSVPYLARLALPAFFDNKRILSVPELGYTNGELSAESSIFLCRFAPLRILSPE